MPRRPRWEEISEDLLRRIQDGEFDAPGTNGQLPKEEDLAKEYEASRNTVREAVGWLGDRDLVRAERGKGTFVVRQPKSIDVILSTQDAAVGGGEGAAFVELARELGHEAGRSSPRVEIQPAPPVVARYLQISDDDQVVLRHQQ